MQSMIEVMVKRKKLKRYSQLLMMFTCNIYKSRRKAKMEKAFILWSYVFLKYFKCQCLLLLIKKYVFPFRRNYV